MAPRVGPPTLAAGTLPPGAILELKCRGSGERVWADVADNGTLFVLKGTKVEFKVESTGGAPNLRNLIRFETCQWSGTAPGAAGSSATRPISFQTNSGAVATPSTVIATFGGQNVRVNVVVFTLNIVSTPADDFAGRSQTELGVDERVILGFTTTPPGVTAVNAGGLLWKFSGATTADRRTVGLLHDPNTPHSPAIADGRARYIAPLRTHPDGELVPASKEVTLQLSVVDGPSKGLGPERTYRIHKPAAHMIQDPADPRIHHWNPVPGNAEVPSAGFFGKIYFTPKNVSFRTLRWREGAGMLKSTGALAGQEHGNIHATTVHVDDQHGTISGGNTNSGCVVEQIDNVHTPGNYIVPAFPVPNKKVGDKKWPITWEYTYRDLASGAWSTNWMAMQKAHHIGILYEDGSFSCFKGHVGCPHCMQPILVKYGAGVAHFWP